MPTNRSSQVSIFMVSSRDRRFRQRRDSLVKTVARTPPPAFLFPNQQCQRPDWLSPTPLFSAGGRRRRLSSGRPLSCQSILSEFFAPSRNSENLAQKSLRAAEGLPSSFRSESIEAREDIHSKEKCKSRFGSVISHSRGPRPDREAAT